MELLGHKEWIKKVTPFPLFYVMRKLYHDAYLPLTYSSHAEADRQWLEESGIENAPPPKLRHRTHGSPDLRSFLSLGRRHYEAIEAGLRSLDEDPGSIRTVLDFGCGCGRTALWFRKLRRGVKYTGVDIDQECIDWDRSFLRFGIFEVDPPKPPTRFASDTFDLIFSISVFTHLDEELGRSWLVELNRLLRPGGYAFLSVHSEHSATTLPASAREKLARRGIVFNRSGALAGIFPGYYQNTHHLWSYVEREWGRTFRVRGKINIGDQDLVLLRKDPRAVEDRFLFLIVARAGNGALHRAPSR
jgi:SAM-dependent methyltransferase